MRYLLHIIIASVLLAVYSCSKPMKADAKPQRESPFDFSQFYSMSSRDEGGIYDAHRKVPLGKRVTLHGLDSLFGKPFFNDTAVLTVNNRGLYEQETPVGRFLPTEIGDTLVMMRRVYGRSGDWIIWINLEIQDTDSLKVLNFIAYDNSYIQI